MPKEHITIDISLTCILVYIFFASIKIFCIMSYTYFKLPVVMKQKNNLLFAHLFWCICKLLQIKMIIFHKNANLRNFCVYFK